MKYAYISVVLNSREEIDVIAIKNLDNILNELSKLHEILIVSNSGDLLRAIQLLEFRGPVTLFVNSEVRESDPLKIEALSRSVGDLIIEWNGRINDLTAELIARIFESSDSGNELIEIEGEVNFIERIFNAAINLLRGSQAPIRSNVGVTFSRYALNQLLSKSKYESKFQILVSNFIHSRRAHIRQKSRVGNIYPVGHKVDILTRGTTIGSTIPFVLAGVSALIGASFAIYAVILYAILGTLPQGWTTLMIAIGMGNASILTLLGLVWSKLSVIQFGLNSQRSSISTCHVISPSFRD